MHRFRDIVASYNTFCTVRRTMGADIASACGQLVVQKVNALDIEEAVIGNKDQIVNKSKPLAKKSKVAPTKEVNNTEDKNLGKLIRPLAIATSIAAACFVVSTAVFFRLRSKR